MTTTTMHTVAEKGHHQQGHLHCEARIGCNQVDDNQDDNTNYNAKANKNDNKDDNC